MAVDDLTDTSLLAHYIRYISTCAGYDKVFRTLQYSARLCAWWLRQNPRVGRPRFDVELFAKQCSSTRKIIGIGNFAEHLVAAIAIYNTSRNSNRDNILRLLSVCHHLGYAIYLTSDIVLYLNAVDFLRSSITARYQHEACKAWFCALVCSIVGGWYRLGMLSTEKDMELMPDDDRARTKIWAQLVSDYFDLSMAGTILGYLKHSDGFVAVSGAISSLIGIWKVWQRTA